MDQTKVSFINSEGRRLAARLDTPIDRKPQAYAIFAHCFTCNKNLTAVRNISRSLTSAGFAVLRFDFTGLGESEGDFEDTGFSSNVSDLVSAAQFLEEEYEAPKLFIGHSMGGAAVLFAAGKIDSIEGVVTIGAPSDPEHVSNLLKDGLDELNAKGEATINIGGRDFKMKKSFLDDLKAHDPKQVVRDLRKPLLVMHSPQDNTVGIENASNIYSWAMHPKSFISLDGADHLLSNRNDSTYTGEVIGSWATRYINLIEPEELKTDKQVVVKLGPEGYTTEVLAGRHSLLADEPKKIGGADLGPTPYGFVMSGLGACTAITLRMYAARKEWDLQGVTVHLSHEKDHYKECDTCESTPKKIDIFQREIEFEGNLTEEQRQRLMFIANKCPVHRTLENEVKVVTVLKE